MKRVAFVSFTGTEYNKSSLNKGVLYLATILKNNNYPVKVFQRSVLYHSLDKSDLYYSTQKFIDTILEFKPDIIGVTFTESNTVKDNIRYISMIKEKNKGVKIAVGGPHITATKDEILSYADIDFAFYGEAERSFLQFIKRYPHYEGVNGLIYRKGGKIIVNSPASPIRDLDSLPFPDYRLVYGIEGLENKLLINYIIFSRGCPYNCNFCYSHRVFMTSKNQKKVRFRSPSKIVDEIEFNIKRNNTHEISVGSESFTFNRKWVIAICKEIIKRKLNLTLYANTRYDLLDEDLIAIMRKAGFRMLHLGFESGSSKILNMYNKGYNNSFRLSDCTEVNRLLLKQGIIPRMYIMLGNPFETFIDTLLTLKFMLKPNVIYFPQPFDPYPGTEWYQRGVKEGFVEDKWYLKKNTTFSDNNSWFHRSLIKTIIYLWCKSSQKGGTSRLGCGI